MSPHHPQHEVPAAAEGRRSTTRMGLRDTRNETTIFDNSEDRESGTSDWSYIQGVEGEPALKPCGLDPLALEVAN